MGWVRVWASLGCVVAATLIAAAPAAAVPDYGALTPAGCIADAGNVAGCGTTQQGLSSANSVATSPDGKSAYVASFIDDAIVRFDRNTTTGALTPAGCIADVGDAASCGTTQQGLNGASSVAVSPDGKSVYVASVDDRSISRFDRNTSTGALTPAGCIADVGDTAGCGTTQQGLNSAQAVTVSPDGKSVYVASFTDDAMARFDRNIITGALTPAGCIADVGDTAGCGTTQQGLDGASSVGVSPDGKSVYVASFTDDAMARFDRSITTGALTPAGCIADAGDTAGCGTTQQGLNGAQAVTVSPDGKSVYVASADESAIVRFDRNTTGALTPAGCIADVGDPAGCGTTQQGLRGASSITVSPDGRSVYAVSQLDDAIVRFDRNTTTGALTLAGCIADAGDPAGCGTTQEGLKGAYSVVVTSDGKSVYAASFTDDTIVRFDRVPDASNHSLIRIPASQFAQAADPSPSTITVSGLDTKISDVNVELEGLSHSLPEDIDILLEGPGGQRVLLTSDAGGGNPGVSDVDLTFDDSAAQQLPVFPAPGPVTSSYRPTNIDGADSFAIPYCNPGPGGVSPQANCLKQAFNGTDPNGTWSLYVVDDAIGDDGQLARGWSLDITTDVVAPETTIDSGPSGTIASSSASFAFSSSDAGSTFACSVDGAAFTACTSPLALSALAEGGHAFAVSATDRAGNVDPTPAIRSFTVSTLTVPPPLTDSGCDAAKAALDQADAALAKAKKSLKKAKASKNKTKIKKAKAKVKKAKPKVKSAQADVDAAC